MSNIKSNASPPATTTNSSLINPSRFKFSQLLRHSSDHNTFPPHYHRESSSSDSDYEEEEQQHSSSSSSSTSTSRRPSHESDNSHTSHSSPYTKSPWVKLSPLQPHHNRINLIGSLLRQEGHVYSLATSSHFLYTGSDSKNIHVWTKSSLQDSGGFKSISGLVKSIIVTPDNKIFTGHQDGKIRIWQAPQPQHIMISSTSHRRVGSLPTWKNTLKSSVDPRRRRSKVGRHFDAVSCLSLDKDINPATGTAAGFLYSGSWDKTIKVWRLKDSKCVDSIKAHDDAVNAVVAAGFGKLVFSGSADGTVKVWRRENHGKKKIRHLYVETLMEQTSAVTSLAVMTSTGTLYAGSSDGLVSFWVWDKLTGIMRYGGVLRGHKLAVLCLATAGSLVLSGSADATVCVWRRDEVGVGGDHVCISVLTGHMGPVKCLAVDEDFGDSNEEEEVSSVEMFDRCRRWRVYTGSVDNSVKVWMVLQDDHLTTPSE